MSAHLDYREVVVGGVKTACVTRGELAVLMVEDCLAARNTPVPPKLVFTTNGNSIAHAALHRGFRRILAAADIIHADGQPVVLASKFTRAPIPERSATTDFFYDACAAAERHGLRMYLLGGSDDANRACAERVQRMYPGIAIAGRRHGYFARSEEAAVCEAINQSRADIVWVGLGLPLEQEFCVRNRDRLRAGWLVTSGGCFNFVIGAYARAPRWMQRAGLEWLHRLWCEPRRLGPRYVLTNPVALFMLLTRTHALSEDGQAHAPRHTALGSEPA
ncbi:MAG: WecB/TagA/CpsF family glycosyltransferase [Alphaproteobacteria bacterium]